LPFSWYAILSGYKEIQTTNENWATLGYFSQAVGLITTSHKSSNHVPEGRVANWHFSLPNNLNLAFFKRCLAVKIIVWQCGIFVHFPGKLAVKFGIWY